MGCAFIQTIVRLSPGTAREMCSQKLISDIRQASQYQAAGQPLALQVQQQEEPFLTPFHAFFYKMHKVNAPTLIFLIESFLKKKNFYTEVA